MTEQEVRTLLTDALVNLFEIEPERIKPETNLYEDLEIDSIDAIDLIDHINAKPAANCKPKTSATCAP